MIIRALSLHDQLCKKILFEKHYFLLFLRRRVAGVVERGGLENRCTLFAYQGFESLTLRKAKPSCYNKEVFFFSGAEKIYFRKQTESEKLRTK